MSVEHNVTAGYSSPCNQTECLVIFGVPGSVLVLLFLGSILKCYLGRYRTDPASHRERREFVTRTDENLRESRALGVVDVRLEDKLHWDGYVTKNRKQTKIRIKFTEFKYTEDGILQFRGIGHDKYGRFKVRDGLYKDGFIAFLTEHTSLLSSFGTSYTAVFMSDNTFMGYWKTRSVVECCGSSNEDIFKANLVMNV